MKENIAYFLIFPYIINYIKLFLKLTLSLFIPHKNFMDKLAFLRKY